MEELIFYWKRQFQSLVVKCLKSTKHLTKSYVAGVVVVNLFPNSLASCYVTFKIKNQYSSLCMCMLVTVCACGWGFSKENASHLCDLCPIAYLPTNERALIIWCQKSNQREHRKTLPISCCATYSIVLARRSCLGAARNTKEKDENSFKI